MKDPGHYEDKANAIMLKVAESKASGSGRPITMTFEAALANSIAEAQVAATLAMAAAVVEGNKIARRGLK